MDLIAACTRHLLLPTYLRWIGSEQLQQYRRLLKSQFLPEEELRRRQWTAVQAMLRYVHGHNRFYRRRLQELGATPEDFKSWEDFARLPLLTKDDLREKADDLLSDGWNVSSLIRKRTGGSTGVPVHLYRDLRASRMKAGAAMRHDEWAHFQVGVKKAALWGDVKPRTSLGHRLTDALYNRTIYLDTLEMDDRSMLDFAEAIRRTSTRLLFGHGHSLYHFARFLRDRRVTDLKLKGIISSSEMLPPAERRVVEEVFGDIVFDRYGCEEVGLIASECERHDGMHVAAEGIYVEILDGTEEVPGRVVVTDLLNHATPILRYEIGDLALTKPGPCTCGRGLPRIGRVIGRTSDFLYTPEGKQISGISLLDTVIIHIPGFRRVQVVQESLDALTFNVVKGEGFSDASLGTLAAAVTKYFGPSMSHKVVVVDAIPLTGRGKFQFSICKVKPAR
jgi:phenylacetate-CoA ligase